MELRKLMSFADQEHLRQGPKPRPHGSHVCLIDSAL